MAKRQKINKRPPRETANTQLAEKSEFQLGTHAFNIALGSLACLIIWMLARHYIVMGSRAGGWAYPYRRWTDAGVYMTGGLIAVAAIAFTRVSRKFIGTYEAPLILAWLIFGYLAHVILIKLSPLSFRYVIASDTANSFYTAAMKYRPLYFLANYSTVAPTLGRHAFTNMPGKTLLYHAMLVFTKSPEVMGYIILGLSDLGAVAAYGAGKRLFGDRTIGLCSMILFIFIPARLFFIPVLNAVTPGLVMVPLWMLACYLDKPRMWLLPLIGVWFFGIFFFEPLSYFCGLSFAAVIVGRWRQNAMSVRSIVMIPVLAAAGFFAAYAILFFTTKFNALYAFVHQYQIAKDFLVEFKRPYWIWLIHGPKEFFLDAGITQTVIFAAVLFLIFWKAVTRTGGSGGMSTVLLDTNSLFVLAFAAGVATLFLTEIHGGGENTRLLLFFTPFLQLIVAWACVRRYNEITFDVVVAASVLQTAVTIATVSFVPWPYPWPK